jgi:hypothetical protein
LYKLTWCNNLYFKIHNNSIKFNNYFYNKFLFYKIKLNNDIFIINFKLYFFNNFLIKNNKNFILKNKVFIIFKILNLDFFFILLNLTKITIIYKFFSNIFFNFLFFSISKNFNNFVFFNKNFFFNDNRFLLNLRDINNFNLITLNSRFI